MNYDEMKAKEIELIQKRILELKNQYYSEIATIKTIQREIDGCQKDLDEYYIDKFQLKLFNN